MIPYMALCCSALLLSIYPGTAQASTLSWVAVVLVAGSGSKWHTQLAGDIHTGTTMGANNSKKRSWQQLEALEPSNRNMYEPLQDYNAF